MRKLGKYSFGIGDRFAHQGAYQLRGFLQLAEAGMEVTPVWNKSFREHKTVNSQCSSVREEADRAVEKLKWRRDYLVDADHVTLETVGEFISYSDFFTIDVANKINLKLDEQERKSFIEKFSNFKGHITISGIEDTFEITEEVLLSMGDSFYMAAKEASAIYRKISASKNGSPFSVEVSMDEVEAAQTPIELYFILAFLAAENIPVNTIAPKFTGRFNKGVDYEGDITAFESEFEQDILVIKQAVSDFDLPEGLKLSVHTGSDKFSLYPVINSLIKKYDAGLHLKTAGTTWLEELIGLAESQGEGLEMAKSIYMEALKRYDELTAPYATVINLNPDSLPSIEEVTKWDGYTYATSLRHDQQHPNYNPHFRQLLHTAYKLAAEKGDRFFAELVKNQEIIGKNVVENIFERHLKPLFLV